MSQSVEEVADLQEYLHGVLNRADHHADNVNEVVLTLVGLILWQKDAEPIRVMTRDGKPTNVLWVHIRGVKYAFSYDHASQTIAMRSDSLQGPLIRSFSNKDTASTMKDFFSSL